MVLDQGAVLVGQQIDENRLSGTVGAHDCRMFVGTDGERQAVEYTTFPLDDGRVNQLENGLWFHEPDLSAEGTLVLGAPMA
jgi:hypothetical protein